MLGAGPSTRCRPGGQLLLADYFADNDRKHNPFGVQMGLTMLASTERGGRLTNAQVHGWLRRRRPALDPPAGADRLQLHLRRHQALKELA